MQTHFRVVVIGGGVVGCSVLYHLTIRGWHDVALLERSELTAGSTWHAAGGMHTLNGDANVAALQKYTIQLYREIEKASGIACGVRQPGGIYLATTERQVDFFRVERAKAHYLGVELDFIPLAEVKRLNPLVDVTKFRAAMFDPNDGYVDPSSVTQAYAAAARRGGAEIHRHRPVTALRRLPGGEWEITTPQGVIWAENIVNAGGLWAREVGALVGLELPIVPLEHQYIVTNDIPELAELDREVAMLVDFEGANYVRQEGRGLLLGTYEQDCRHWATGGTPLDFGIELLPPDLDRIAGALDAAIARIPALADAGVKRVVNGAMVFSPDGNPIIGPVAFLPGYFLAAGCMAGFSQGGGVGLAVANWIVDGEPGMDVFAMDVARFGLFATQSYVRTKTIENYQRRFVIPCPNEELPAARPGQTSAIYEDLRAVGAVFGCAAGWEVPLWFAASANEAQEAPSFRRSNAFGPVGEECHAVRTAVGIWETSSYCKIEISGTGAAAWLDCIVANGVPRTDGLIALCPMLSPAGRILGDVTLMRLASDRFLMMGSPVAEAVYLRWLHENVRQADVRVRGVSRDFQGLAITGPRAREVLARVTAQDVSASSLPFMSIRRFGALPREAWVARVSFTGELGYEIYSAPEDHRSIYRAVLNAGGSLGLRHFGVRALNSLRLEKGYGGWGREYTSDYTPDEAGIGRLVQMRKGNFIGKDAVLASRTLPANRALRLLKIETDQIDPFGNEALFAAGRAVARLTSAAHSYTLDCALALAYLNHEITSETPLEIELLGERYPAQVLPTVPYDPTGARLRA